MWFTTLSLYLISRITEISYILSSILMLFASDLIMGRLLLRRLKKSNFIIRTLLFVLYAILVLPGLTTAGAWVLRQLVLTPLSEWIVLVLAVFFLIVGVLLSLRYNMKIR